jgi:hypothetical protein
VDAVRLISTKRVYADGLIVQAVVWWLPSAVPPARHRCKYRLLCGHPGKRLMDFDNERGKGDRQHVLDVESAHRFTTLEKLLVDFAAAIEQVTGRSP